MIGEIATIALQDTSIPIIYSIVSIVSVVFLEVILSYLQMLSLTFRKFIDGSPIIIIQNGKFIMKALKKEKLTINDVLESLRSNGDFDLSQIQYAILECNGKVSVIPKGQSNPPKIPVSLIIDGEISRDGLKIAQKDINWLLNKLRESKIHSQKEVAYAYLDTNSKFNYQLKKE